MIKIKGQIQKGFDCARSTIPLQKPHLRKYIENIKNYYDGTINVLLERPLIIFKPDIVTRPIQWDNRQHPIPYEKFGFVNIKFEIAGSKESLRDALIYIAYRSPHYANPFYVEILAPEIKHIQSDFCNIIIEKKIKETAGSILLD